MKFVESRYGSRWIGVVIDEYRISTSYPKKYEGLGYTVLVVKDGSGRTPRKRIVHNRNRDWFKKVEPFDISHINKDWFLIADIIQR